MNSEIELEDGLYYRQTLFDKAKRVVVKVGSAILTGENGLNKNVIDNLAKEISFLHGSGREVILVTSGAVSAGKRKIHINDNIELTIKQKQALAAIGQSSLMHDYDEAFAGYGKNIAQILLTHSDLANRKRYLNVRNTILTLQAAKMVSAGGGSSFIRSGCLQCNYPKGEKSSAFRGR